MEHMDIVQVATGLISIPPNGWGAVERIIWEYDNNLTSLGVNSLILDWSKVEKKDNQLVHCHMADRKSTRLNSSHIPLSRMPSSA